MLLLLGIISSGSGDDGWSTTLPIKVWARALGTTLTTTGQSATTAVSKTLTRLEDRKLITRTRRGRERNIRVTLLPEDGSGDPYTRPAAGNRDRFLQLPHTFWLDGWHDRLDLPATAMLLVALHEKPGFELPTEKIPEWYGWSADTAERGLKTLISLGVLTKTERVKKAPLSPSGLTSVNQYTLQPPFAPNPQAIGTTTEKGDTTAASPDRITRRRRPTRPRTTAPATTATRRGRRDDIAHGPRHAAATVLRRRLGIARHRLHRLLLDRGHPGRLERRTEGMAGSAQRPLRELLHPALGRAPRHGPRRGTKGTVHEARGQQVEAPAAAGDTGRAHGHRINSRAADRHRLPAHQGTRQGLRRGAGHLLHQARGPPRHTARPRRRARHDLH